MKKNIICIIICGVLSLALIAGGLLALMDRDQKRTENEAAIEKLQQEQILLSKSTSEKEAAALQKSNEQLQQEIEALESECADLDRQALALQQEYEKLSQDETNIYYMTILEALQKGMEKVEGYINNAQ